LTAAGAATPPRPLYGPQIAARNGVSLPYKNLAQAKAARTNYTDLQGFLDVYNEVGGMGGVGEGRGGGALGQQFQP
jgi:hypothetical protein